MSLFKYSTLIMISLFSHLSLANSTDGFGLSFSRIVMLQDEKNNESISVNNNTDNVYLVQSWVRDADGVTGLPLNKDNDNIKTMFVVLPPLKKINPRSSFPLRILIGSDSRNLLPKDRESLFFLSVKAIPSVEKTDNENDKGVISIALLNSIKLFYRPASLEKYAIEKIASKLVIDSLDKCVSIKNPTPYYITFSTLSINGLPIDESLLQTMISPFGTQCYAFSHKIKDIANISWSLIDEDGISTLEQHQLINLIKK